MILAQRDAVVLVGILLVDVAKIDVACARDLDAVAIQETSHLSGSLGCGSKQSGIIAVGDRACVVDLAYHARNHVGTAYGTQVNAAIYRRPAQSPNASSGRH